MATDYRIEFTPSARRQLKKLPLDVIKKIARAIDGLQTNPYPDGVRKLVNENNLYRMRVGDYRIVYQVKSNTLIIVIVRVRHRKYAFR
jgi:mRNA interferase RelE/StbE